MEKSLEVERMYKIRPEGKKPRKDSENGSMAMSLKLCHRKLERRGVLKNIIEESSKLQPTKSYDAIE